MSTAGNRSLNTKSGPLTKFPEKRRNTPHSIRFAPNVHACVLAKRLDYKCAAFPRFRGQNRIIAGKTGDFGNGPEHEIASRTCGTCRMKCSREVGGGPRGI